MKPGLYDSPSKLYKYGTFPPLPSAVILPVDSLKHNTSNLDKLQVSSTGSVIITSHIVVQPLASVTSTVCTPADKAVAVCVDSPLSHR